MTDYCRLKNAWGITKNVKIYTFFYLKFQIFNWWLPSWCILTCYRYTDSWTINRNRAAPYPLPTFTNMLTVDKPTAMEQLYISYSVSLKKTVWHVPGTLWRPGKCRFVNCQQWQLSTMLWHTSYWRFLMYLHGYMVTSPSLVKSGFINQKSWKKPKSYNLSNPFPSENGF